MLGYKHYFERGDGHRASGSWVSPLRCLGRNHPAGVGRGALLFGTLSQGGFAVSEQVPKEIIEVLQPW